jgi:hypothetical protein
VSSRSVADSRADPLEPVETVAAHPSALWVRAVRRIDGTALATWVLASGLVLYLGLDGGGYDIVVRSQVGVVVWWIVLIGAAWGILPSGRLTRVGWGAIVIFGGFVAWTALASTWSLSSERSLAELSRVASYLGILLLAVAIHRDREQAVRHTVNAVALAVTAVAALALVSRLFPSAFPAAQATGAFLGGAQSRLSWPLNYWNGLAALVALGLPLLLSIATSARSLRAQAAAAAAIPAVALCGYLTASRGGAIASAVAIVVFLALAPDRFTKLATIGAAGAGSAILIVGAVHRAAIQNGLDSRATAAEGRQLLVAIVLVCAGVALAQAGIGFAARHGTLPRLLRVSPRHAQGLLAGGVALAVVLALALGVPSRLSHTWHDFKYGGTATVGTNLGARFGSFSGGGRYQYWKVAVHTTGAHAFTGSGPGTFQLLWEPRAPFFSYVINAHSLYVETLAETGVVGLCLLVGFMVLVIGIAVRLVIRSEYEARVRAAGAAAALLAFAVSATADWVWQLPVLPAAFLLLAAAVLAPAPRDVSVRARETGIPSPAARSGAPSRRLAIRSGLVVVALACLVAVAVPLATASGVRQSQNAVSAGNTSLALAAARTAARVEPGAASPQLQAALVLELQRNYPAALAAARNAIGDQPQDWTGWLIISRLEAESGHAKTSVLAYRRARSLNPRSPLFQR